MTCKSKFPLPVHATGFRFLTDPSLPTHAVLEIDTAANPLRVDFDKEQLEKLARDAILAGRQVQPPKGPVYCSAASWEAFKAWPHPT
jgi:hypothetical protein